MRVCRAVAITLILPAAPSSPITEPPTKRRVVRSATSSHIIFNTPRRCGRGGGGRGGPEPVHHGRKAFGARLIHRKPCGGEARAEDADNRRPDDPREALAG